jgi:hypothetical protein
MPNHFEDGRRRSFIRWSFSNPLAAAELEEDNNENSDPNVEILAVEMAERFESEGKSLLQRIKESEKN